MVKRVMTWVDLQGRYRVTSPAYADLIRANHSDEEGAIQFDEDDAINWVWTKIVAAGGYGIALDHPHHLVKDEDQRLAVANCAGNHFRYDEDGGAWVMQVDGTPVVNMDRARDIQRKYIIRRLVSEKGIPQLNATAIADAFDLETFLTPVDLASAVPVELL